MIVDFLERDHILRTLDEVLGQVSTGQGRTVLIRGEAGIGKTSVIECFAKQHQSDLRLLWGSCEALFTPRPLGPLYDIAHQAQTSLSSLLDGEVNRATLFAAVLDELAHGSLPTVLIIEDIHWADEATLDLVKFLARRIPRARALLVLTHRDDELGREHPLWHVLGDLPARNVTRLQLHPLSEAAVAVLAQQAGLPRSSGDLYAATGGNPFFVTEILASDAPGVPASVRDAVLARIARLSYEAQCFLELASVVPTKVEWRAVEAMTAVNNAWLEECLAAGIVRLEDGALEFRHELARQAVEGALSPTRKRALNVQVLRAFMDLGEGQIPLARLVHHAAQAEDSALVLEFAPEAARQASVQGAHREAAAHYRTALRYLGDVDAGQHASLLEELSYEQYLTGQIDDAVQPREEAIAIWRRLGQHEKIGHNLRQLSRLSWFLGKNAEAERYAREAVDLLETLPPGRELAMAYANLSQLCMLASDNASTVLWGERAIELAERLHDYETVSFALNNIGSAEFCSGNEQGRAKLESSLQLALEHGYEVHVARAYTNLAENEIVFRHYDRAKEYLMLGLAYCAERDLNPWIHSMRKDWARARLEQGDWEGAEEDAAALLDIPWVSPANRIPALLVLSLLRIRRGDPGTEAMLDELRDRALATGEMQNIAPMAAARAEWCWLQGNREQCLAEALVGVQKAMGLHNPWYLGEVMVWYWRAGGAIDSQDEVAAPFALEMAGGWRAAADAWERIGCPYEQALALMDGDEAAQRTALAIFERLGARPAADIARRQLRGAGVRGLPRGPRPATRSNPHGLTNRQLEILSLLAEGLRNVEIANRLSTTPKTVEHHVSAVLAKLDARSRAEAVRVAYQLGLVP